MSKVEERALEFYPMKDYNKEPNYIHSCDSKMLDEVYREVFMLGYEQAEKDLIPLAQLWVDSGDANVMSFEQFLKFHETQGNK